MKIKKLFGAAITIGAVFLIASAQTERSPRRITFARGATVARATGYLRGIRDRAWFALRASSGQHMRVEINAPGSTRGSVIYPSGKQDGQPGGVIFDDTIDETGDYKIVVSESSMGEAWRGRFTVKVEVQPRGQSNPNPSDLAKYTGKYPSELFKRVPAIKTRLRQMLGANYAAFMGRMQTQTPIEKDGDILIMRGCEAHSCTVEEALLAIDLNDGKLYVALRFNGNFSKTFPANRSQLPEALKRAMLQ